MHWASRWSPNSTDLYIRYLFDLNIQLQKRHSSLIPTSKGKKVFICVPWSAFCVLTVNSDCTSPGRDGSRWPLPVTPEGCPPPSPPLHTDLPPTPPNTDAVHGSQWTRLDCKWHRMHRDEAPPRQGRGSRSIKSFLKQLFSWKSSWNHCIGVERQPCLLVTTEMEKVADAADIPVLFF